MFPKHHFQSSGIEYCIVGYLVYDISKVCEEVSLVFVCEDGRDAGIVEFYVGVFDADEVDAWVRGHERGECFGDELGDWTLSGS